MKKYIQNHRLLQAIPLLHQKNQQQKIYIESSQPWKIMFLPCQESTQQKIVRMSIKN